MEPTGRRGNGKAQRSGSLPCPSVSSGLSTDSTVFHSTYLSGTLPSSTWVSAKTRNRLWQSAAATTITLPHPPKCSIKLEKNWVSVFRKLFKSPFTKPHACHFCSNRMPIPNCQNKTGTHRTILKINNLQGKPPQCSACMSLTKSMPVWVGGIFVAVRQTTHIVSNSGIPKANMTR